MLCARDLLLWLRGCEGSCRSFLKVSNRDGMGEYLERLGFLSPFRALFVIDEAGAGETDIDASRSAMVYRCGVVP